MQAADPPPAGPAPDSASAKPAAAGPAESKPSPPAGATPSLQPAAPVLRETPVPGASVELPPADGGKPTSFLIPEGSAPKPAEWKIQPAQEEWCPAILSAKYPELKRHEYEDTYAVERALANSWRVAGATRRGKIHAHQGTHREDAFRFSAGPNFTILCVADGAGSAKFSRLGSHVAVQRVTEYLAKELAQIEPAVENSSEALLAFLKAQISKAVCSACLALEEIAANASASPRDFRSTLLTALRYHGKSQQLLLTNQIGDGAICVLFNDKTVQRCGAADSGEFSGEVGCFLPDDCARKKALEVQSIAAEKVECLVLCSDGIEDPFYPMEKRAPDIFRQLYSGVKKSLPNFDQPLQPPILTQDSVAAGLAQWLGFERRGENDDRTLLLLHRFPAAVSF